MKINYNEINKRTRLGLLNKSEVLHYVAGVIDYLYSHNKNYTKEQYYKIEDLKNIIDCIVEGLKNEWINYIMYYYGRFGFNIWLYLSRRHDSIL